MADSVATGMGSTSDDDGITADEHMFDFLSDPHEFEGNGFNELELSKQVHHEALDLYLKLIRGRSHNESVTGKRGVFSQKSVGRRMGGVSQSYVSQLENGLVDLVGTLSAYAVAAGLNVQYRVSSAVDGGDIDAQGQPASTVSMEYRGDVPPEGQDVMSDKESSHVVATYCTGGAQ